MLEGIAVVIPTRNRADFAERAILSVLASRQPAVPVTVLVSDNSSDPVALARLEAFCQSRQAEPGVRLHYVHPAEDLSMSRHWDWARDQLSALSGPSHCLYLTDRSVLKPHALVELSALAQAYPADVISYDADEIDDARTPVTLRQVPTTGTVVVVGSARLLYLAAQMVLVKALPRMLNCMLPIAVLDRVAGDYGSVFDSVAPDFCFCFRTLLEVDRVIYCDKPLFTMHGTARSNGATTANGVVTQDSADFLSRAAADGVLHAGTAIPPVSTNYAIVGREYLRAGNEQQTALMPALNRPAAVLTVTIETESFAPGVLRDSNIAALRAEGVRFGPVHRLRRQAARAAHYARVLGWFDFAVQTAARIPTRRPVVLADTDAALAYAVDRPRRCGPAVALRYLRGRQAKALG